MSCFLGFGNLENLSSIPETHIVEGDKPLPYFVLCLLQVYSGAYIHTY